jgi:histone H3/H4
MTPWKPPNGPPSIFNPALHRALRLKAAEAEVSLSELVNDAVKRSLAEDAEDLAAVTARRREKTLRFEDVVKALRRDGKI